jgi:hypothetical protein
MAKISNETKLIQTLFNDRVAHRINTLSRMVDRPGFDTRSKTYGYTEAQEILSDIIRDLENK